MPVLHIANTDFEFELSDEKPLPLIHSLRRNPIVHQLQFLPLLYMNPGDGICVTDAPLDGPSCHLISDHNLPYDAVTTWGASRNVAAWAKEHNLSYSMPPWDVVKKVNSKAFSFEEVEPLPHAELIHNWKELEAWINQTSGPRVLKNCFGLSGQGHLPIPAPLDKLKNFVEKEFHAKRPIIAEPWVTRILDFSTQWIIHHDQSIEYLGSTILKSDEKGRYSGTIVGVEIGTHLVRHKEVAIHTLKKMAALGFFGNVGIDSMIWGNDHLHPIVEINARKTMGFIALEIRKRLFPNQTIEVSYSSASNGQPLLPQGITKPSGEEMKFNRNLYVLAQ